ncbi:MAG: ABC transporter permease, partial [Planctomycetes bacterium]|nr:ABC transporter permease [Planctomycetota bacterium]
AAMLAEADASLPSELARFGFEMTAQEFEKVKVQARLSVDAEALLRTLSMPVIKQRLSVRAGVKVRNVTPNLLLKTAKSSRGAKWLAEQMSEQASKLAEAKALRKSGKAIGREQKALLDIADLLEGFNYSPERIREVASDRLAQDKLAATEASVSQTAAKTGTGFRGFSPRTLWLIGVSFLVCIVGITNAMLMSVTDRFREIATMKCLGATDGFIMINFVLESCIQGTAGGVLGVILGLVLGVLRSATNYGWISLVNFPLASAFTVALWAIVAGVVISAMAAVYPAWVAARLAPMEAMRIE